MDSVYARVGSTEGGAASVGHRADAYKFLDVVGIQQTLFGAANWTRSSRRNRFTGLLGGERDVFCGPKWIASN